MVQTTVKKAKQTEPQVEKFERFEKQAKQPAWVFPLRKAGIVRFAELGFPTLHDEDWRFTNVGPIAKLPFHPIFEPVPDGVTAEMVARFTFGSLPAKRLVFVNGHYAPELSVRASVPREAVIGQQSDCGPFHVYARDPIRTRQRRRTVAITTCPSASEFRFRQRLSIRFADCRSNFAAAC